MSTGQQLICNEIDAEDGSSKYWNSKHEYRRQAWSGYSF